MSSTDEPTMYEKVTSAIGLAPAETDAHKVGREAGEAVSGAATAASDAVGSAATSVGEAFEGAKESVTPAK